MTDKLRQAAEMALKALKNETTVYVRFDNGVVDATEILEDALMEALAESPNSATNVVEPIGEVYTRQVDDFPVRVVTHFYGEPPLVGTKLYAAPPKREWVSLTDDEIYPMYCEPRSDAEMIAFVRELEAKLKKKNNG